MLVGSLLNFVNLNENTIFDVIFWIFYESPLDSSRIVGLVQLLLKADAAKSLVEDYATCLELRFDECQIIENTKDDVGVLILQVVLNSLCFSSSLFPICKATHCILISLCLFSLSITASY